MLSAVSKRLSARLAFGTSGEIAAAASNERRFRCPGLRPLPGGRPWPRGFVSPGNREASSTSSAARLLASIPSTARSPVTLTLHFQAKQYPIAPEHRTKPDQFEDGQRDTLSRIRRND